MIADGGQQVAIVQLCAPIAVGTGVRLRDRRRVLGFRSCRSHLSQTSCKRGHLSRTGIAVTGPVLLKGLASQRAGRVTLRDHIAPSVALLEHLRQILCPPLIIPMLLQIAGQWIYIGLRKQRLDFPSRNRSRGRRFRCNLLVFFGLETLATRQRQDHDQCGQELVHHHFLFHLPHNGQL